MNELKEALQELDRMGDSAASIVANPHDRLLLFNSLAQVRATLLLAQEVRQLGIYLGSLQENMQHIDEMLREANDGETA